MHKNILNIAHIQRQRTMHIKQTFKEEGEDVVDGILESFILIIHVFLGTFKLTLWPTKRTGHGSELTDEMQSNTVFCNAKRCKMKFVQFER